MSSGQTPAWLTIFVAILGMVGVVTAQLVSSWREGQRWKREMHREDLQWERETRREESRWGQQLELDSIKLAYDHQQQWREAKTRIYGNVLHAVEHHQEKLKVLDWNLYSIADAKMLRDSELAVMSCADELYAAITKARLVAADELSSFLSRPRAFHLPYGLLSDKRTSRIRLPNCKMRFETFIRKY